MKPFHPQPKGQVLVLVALLMVFLIGVAALAIDIGRAYGVKTKLKAAVDAASYEAAKAMAEGRDETAKKGAAAQVAVSYFNANYRNAFLGATPPIPSVAAVRDKTGMWQVTVSATAHMPTLFAGLLGWKTLDIKATSEAVRATLDMVLVLDVSDTMTGVFTLVKSNATDFINHFDELDDYLGLVAFSTGAYPIVSICGKYPNDVQNPPPNSVHCERGYSKENVSKAIDRLSLGQATASSEGVKKAVEQLASLKKPSDKQVIVFLSDGAPNTFNGRFLLASGTRDGNLYSGRKPLESPKTIYDPTKYYDRAPFTSRPTALPETDPDGIPVVSYNGKRTLTGITTDPYLKCDANAISRNLTENVANEARKKGIIIYTLGLGAMVKGNDMQDPRCGTFTETGETILKRLANTVDSDTYNKEQPTGIYCYAEDIDGLKPCFDKLANALLRISK